MRYIPLLSLLILSPLSANADDVPIGCYSRDYSDAHLAQHPEQVVDLITVRFTPQDAFTAAEVQVLFAHQGHAERDGYGGMRASEIAGNFDTPLRFVVECDGGYFDVVENTTQGIMIETPWLRVADEGCAEGRIHSTLLEEGSTSTRYWLVRSDDRVCDW